MNVKLVNKVITENYGAELLKERGVEDLQIFLHPPKHFLQEARFLDNIDKGAKLLLDTISNNGKMLIVVDSDCDGYTSFAIMYQYIKKINEKADVSYVLHKGKQHGLEDHIDNLLDSDEVYDLIILPDASSGDYDYHKALYEEKGTKCLVLDHHLLDKPIYEHAVIINNQISKDYHNKELTGAGVVYQFCNYLDEILEKDYNTFTDIAALGIIGDMGSVINMENRYIITKGLSDIRSFFFNSILEKQAFSMGGVLSPMTISFYIVPMINAMIRVGTQKEKENLALAFIDGTKLIDCNKRGAKGTLEKAAIESLRECVNAKNKQDKIKKEMAETLEIQIFKNDLLENKILFIEVDEDLSFPQELTGLIAMQLSAKFKKPTLITRLSSEGALRGSARGVNDSELTDLKGYLDSTGLFNYNAGHAAAFGTSIDKRKLNEFLKRSNEDLAGYDFSNSAYDVNFYRYASDKDLTSLIYDLDEYKETWGCFNKEPLTYIRDINISSNDVQIMGKLKDTVKITKFGVAYMFFRAKQLIEELEGKSEIKLNVVGKANLNEWGGRKTPQIFVENYELLENSEYSF